MKNIKKYFGAKKIVLIVLISCSIAIMGYIYIQQNKNPSVQKSEDIYITFLFEVYNKIQENYWDKITDEQLRDLFEKGAEKITNWPQILDSNDKNGLEKMFIKIMKDMNQAQKQEFSSQIANIVLANLQPYGRSGLYTTQDEQILQNRVNNVNLETDLYNNLGLVKNASEKEIQQAYKDKKHELELDESPETAQKLEKINYTFQVLSDPIKKQVYDESGIEPTILSKLLDSGIFYIKIKKISPNSFEEFKREVNNIDNIEASDSLIIDLRGNVGGSLDILPYFLGPFIGPNQYAVELFQQGEYEPYKTVTGWLPGLVKYKKVVILIDSQTQSSAEVMAAAFKKYNVGVIVGATTKGWGTIEKVFELENQISANTKYSMFLVHHLTVGEDGQPIEGRGVSPTISIENPDWEKELFAYFHYDKLVEAVKEIIKVSF
ncbi:MAG: DnaJ domain-containing protein [Candidatus Pacebacteria bacterium]|nr:DnaJ domain-containing protein [Candidatus Paceibacterota bacterium]